MPKYLPKPKVSETQYCANCPLLDSPYVPGEGDDDCQAMVIGSAPGAEGRVFAGKSGELLRGLLRVLGVERKVYLTNVVKRRPETAEGAQRRPTKDECFHCGMHLIKELDRRLPKVVLTVGQTPTQFFLGRQHSILQVHGLPITMNRSQIEITVIPTYDPSFVLHRGGINSRIGDQFLSDLEEFRTRIDQEGL